MADTKDRGGGKPSGKPSIYKIDAVKEKEYRVIRQRIRSAIRQVWSRYSPERKDALYEAKRTKKRTNKDGSTSRIPNIVYVCAACQEEFKEKDTQVDHVTPVGATPEFPPTKDGDNTWVDWMLRLFFPTEPSQVLCLPCHKLKTIADREAGKHV